MHIESKTFAIIMKLLIGVLSLAIFWVSLATFGVLAWRLFFTWVLLLASIYYLLSAAVLAFSEHEHDYALCPMLVGLFLINFLLISITSFIFAALHLEITLLTGLPAAVLYGTLPVLIFADWILFTKKGKWRPMYPFYWLSLSVAYAAFIILTANIAPNQDLVYPLAFLDWQAIGITNFAAYLSVFAIIILAVGYLLILIDGLVSGKISQYIVLPRIETVEEDAE